MKGLGKRKKRLQLNTHTHTHTHNNAYSKNCKIVGDLNALDTKKICKDFSGRNDIVFEKNFIKRQILKIFKKTNLIDNCLKNDTKSKWRITKFRTGNIYRKRLETADLIYFKEDTFRQSLEPLLQS